MKVILTEDQYERLKRIGFYKKMFYKYWDKKPVVDDTFINLFPLKELGLSVLNIYPMLTEYLGEDNAKQMAMDVINKDHRINRGDCGGYEFDFQIEKVDEDSESFEVNVYVSLKGASVALIMVGGELMTLEDALKDEDIGWEIKEEVENCIIDYIQDNILNKTGIIIRVQKLRFI